MIILFHLSQQDNHQLCWSDLPLPAKEEIHLEYVTHSQRKYNLDYPDDDFYEGHYIVLSWCLLIFYALIFFIVMRSFYGSLGIAVSSNL